MQLNVPNPYVAGAVLHRQRRQREEQPASRSAATRGRVAGVDLFGTVGTTDAHFGAGSQSSGVDVSGNERCRTPPATRRRRAASSRGRLGPGRVDATGARTSCSTGVPLRRPEPRRAGRLLARQPARRASGPGHSALEGWVKNAFDTTYVPVAFAYGGLTPSGLHRRNRPSPHVRGVRTRGVLNESPAFILL